MVPAKFLFKLNDNGSELNDDPGLKLSFVCQCQMFMFGRAHRGSTWAYLVPTVCELRDVFLVPASPQYVNKFDCISVILHCKKLRNPHVI